MTVFKRTVITVTIVIISAIIVVIAYSTNYKTQSTDFKSKPKAIKSEVEYLVKEHNGKIAIFKSGNNEPLTVLDSPYIRDLPQKDQEMLINGIVATNKAELYEILEDYDN